jgi:hypothetical protein
MGWRPLLILIVGAIAVAAVALLPQRGSEPGTFAQQAASLREQSAPPGARCGQLSSIDRDQWTARVSWESSVPMTWDDYCQWLRGRMPGYTADISPGRAIFKRYAEGDGYAVCVETISSGPPLHIRVTFNAYAD